MRRAETQLAETGGRRSELLVALEEIISRRLAGEEMTTEAVAARWPELMPDLADSLRDFDRVDGARRAAVADLTRAGSSEPRSAAGPILQSAPLAIAAYLPGYRIVREVHRGGQGVVYEAIQESTHRRVAVKVLRNGPLSSARDLARFDREVRILAGLRHPNIVAIHDRATAGEFDYFVMDFVDGVPFDRFVAEAAWPARKTAELAIALCEAVAAAHARGVIHRDLKPGNVLVVRNLDSPPEPRVLDFGLAKLTDDDDSAAVALESVTEPGQFLGSLPWASPEQAAGRGAAVDVRSDVYSIGVMLYHAVAGVLPYSRDGALGDVLSRIIHEEPPPPSRHRREIDADLDAIILTCLAKSPAGRYQSVTELAADLRRYVDGESIIARAPGRGERAIRLLRRHRVLVGAALAVFAALLTGLAGTTWKAFAEIRERERAEREVAKQRAIRQVLESILISPDPFYGGGAQTRVSDVMDRVAERLSDELREQPEVEADVRLTLANSYRHLGRLAEAESNLRRGIDLREQVFGAGSLEALEPRIILGYLHETGGRLEEAEQAYRRVIDDLRTARGPDDADALTYSTHLGRVLNGLGRVDEADDVLSEAVKQQSEAFGPDHEKALYSRQLLARVRGAQHRIDEALEMIRLVIDARRSAGGEEHPTTLSARASEALILLDAGRPEEAEAILRSVSVLAEARLGADHQTVLSMHADLARVLLRLGRIAEAEALAETVYTRAKSLPGQGRVLESARRVWIDALRASGDTTGATALEELAPAASPRPSESPSAGDGSDGAGSPAGEAGPR